MLGNGVSIDGFGPSLMMLLGMIQRKVHLESHRVDRHFAVVDGVVVDAIEDGGTL